MSTGFCPPRRHTRIAWQRGAPPCGAAKARASLLLWRRARRQGAGGLGGRRGCGQPLSWLAGLRAPARRGPGHTRGAAPCAGSRLSGPRVASSAPRARLRAPPPARPPLRRPQLLPGPGKGWGRAPAPEALSWPEARGAAGRGACRAFASRRGCAWEGGAAACRSLSGQGRCGRHGHGAPAAAGAGHRRPHHRAAGPPGARQQLCFLQMRRFLCARTLIGRQRGLGRGRARRHSWSLRPPRLPYMVRALARVRARACIKRPVKR